MSSSVSVIIVSYHTGPTLWLTIESSLQQPECKEIIVVNNGNMAGVEKRLRDIAEKEPRVKFISGHGNVGFGKGNNLGVASATGDYVLLLNPDSMLPKDGIATMLAEMAKFSGNTLAGCYLINPDGTEQRGGRRALLNPLNSVAESLGLSVLLKSSDKLNYNNLEMPVSTHEVPAISGAFMMLSTAFYQELGGFDEDYFLHMEDMDLCYRVHKAGGKVICVPSVKVMHFRSTSEVTSSFIEKYKAKGFIRYLRKFFSDTHSGQFLKAMEIGIYLRLWIKILVSKIDRLFLPPLAAKQEIARIALLYALTRFGESGDNLSGKTIIVTGATSQAGLCIIGKALGQGARVIAVYNTEKVEFEHDNLEWWKFDLQKKGEIAEFLQIKADILMHTASLSLLPALLTENTHDSLKRIIVLTSFNVHDEDDMALQADIFRLGKEHIFDITILNPLIPYGVGLDKIITPMADIIKRFGFIPVYRDGSGFRNPAKIQDAADAVIAIIDNGKTFGKAYNIGGSQKVSYREMVQGLADYIGKPVRFIKIPFMPVIISVLGQIYQSRHLNAETAKRINIDISFDNTEAIEDFYYKPSSFLQGSLTV